MSDLNLNLRDYAEAPIQGPLPTQVSETSGGPPQTGNQASTIEQSEEVAALFLPLLNYPSLPPPSNDSTNAFEVMSVAVFALNQKDGWANFILTQQLKMQEITQEILDGWQKNIREIEEQVRQLINSPIYQAEQQIRLKGDPSQGVSGIQSNVQANAALNHPTASTVQDPSLVSFIDNARAIERVPPNATVPDSNAPDDSTKAITIPLTAAVLVGGALALGSFEMTTSTTGMSSNPFSGAMQIVDRLQQIYPPQLVQDVLPMINLAVMPLVYFTSWDSTIGNMRNRERDNHLAEAQNFAQQVIKMVSDPAFVMVTFVNKMAGADQLSPERKDQLAAMIKLVLASVALSLLYSLDVGKVAGGKFGGMTPEEFRDILSGKLALADPNDPQLSESQRSQLTLLSQVRAQLDILPSEQKLQTIETLFTYLTEPREIDSMLDPTKVFRGIFEGGFVNSEVGANSLGNARI